LILKNILATFEKTGLFNSAFSCCRLLKRMSRDARKVCYEVTRT